MSEPQVRDTLKKRRFTRKATLRARQAPNTYHLSPVHPFHPKVVQELLQEKVPKFFEGILEYDFKDHRSLCKFLSLDLLRSVNALYWPSYKIVVAVQCSEKAGQIGRGALRYYWNPTFDGVVNFFHDSENYYVSVTAAFFYYE